MRYLKLFNEDVKKKLIIKDKLYQLLPHEFKRKERKAIDLIEYDINKLRSIFKCDLFIKRGFSESLIAFNLKYSIRGNGCLFITKYDDDWWVIELSSIQYLCDGFDGIEEFAKDFPIKYSNQ